jgi:DNA-binding NarL/FixJ family response regulator
MSMAESACVLLADPHHAMREGIRGLLGTTFKAVVMVADEVSLFESAARLHNELLVLDLALADGNAVDLVRRLHNCFPAMKMIIVSTHDRLSVSNAVLEAGADAFVAKRTIATDLLPAADAVLAGHRYVSPGVMDHRPGGSPERAVP